jgi:hypothetical protein
MDEDKKPSHATVPLRPNSEAALASILTPSVLRNNSLTGLQQAIPVLPTPDGIFRG